MDKNPYNPYQPDQQQGPTDPNQSAPYGGGSDPSYQSQPGTDPYQKQPTVDPYQTYPYQPGVPPVQNNNPPAKGLAIASLVLGIVSVVCCFFLGGFLGIPGLICAIIAMAKGNRSGLAIAGLILSIVGFLLFVAQVAFMLAYPSALENALDGYYYYYQYY